MVKDEKDNGSRLRPGVNVDEQNMNEHYVQEDDDEADDEEKAVRKFSFEELLYHKFIFK